jgi:hypothetical protein
VCRFAGKAEDQFFSWFAIESHSSPDMVKQLRAALGMCPAHTRRLLEGEIETEILTSVYREVAQTAVARIDTGDPSGACPACASEQFNVDYALTGVLRALADPALARRYVDGGGLCLPHLLAAAPTAPPSELRLVCDTLAARLEERPEIAALAGLDRDAVNRAGWRARLPDRESSRSKPRDSVEALLERLAIDACPACLLGGEAERRYLSWLVAEQLEHGQVFGNDPGEVCSAHLADLAVLDADTAAAAASHSAAGWSAELSVVSAELGLPAAGSADRGRGGSRRRADAGQPRGLRRWAAPATPRRASESDGAARVRLTGDHLCPVCRAVAVAQRRELALLAAALKLPAVADAYRSGHGLCARHVLKVTEEESASLPRRHVAARLGVLAWELQESSRKQGWGSRHEPKGPEASAYLRFIAQVDGHALIGAPAPAQAGPLS